jgi:hypothetical protein
MVNRIERKEGSPRTRLEGWLVRKIHSRALEALPWYCPIGGRGQCPEQYARALLVGLQTAEGNHAMLERLKDDGRAFRSWAESVLSCSSHTDDYRSGYRASGFAV